MLTIYGAPISVHTRKPILAAALKGLDVTVEPILPFDPPENWRSLSPSGLIPAMRHDDFVIAESSAICAYLERLAPSPSLYPSEDRAYARALALEQYATTALYRSVIHPMFFETVVKPSILRQGPADAAVVGKARDEAAPDVFDYLESQITGGVHSPAFIGDQPTIADVAVFSNLANAAYLGLPVDAGRWPTLAGLFDGMLENAAIRAVIAAEAPFAERMGLRPLA